MIRRLIFKDFYFQRPMLVLALAGGFVGLVLLGLGHDVAFHTGTVLLITALIGHGAYLAMDSVIEERKAQTLAFVLSLPISFRDYVKAKIFGNLLIFGISWSLLTAGTLVLFSVDPEIPNGLIPISLILLTEIFASTALILAVSLITNSVAWAIGCIIAGNIVFNGFLFFLARVPSIGNTIEGPVAVWHRDTLLMLGAEVATIVAALTVAYFVVARRKDFI